MADSMMSITVKDVRHPCAPYQTSGDSFRVQIYHCDGKPLFWDSKDYGHGVWLTTPGHGGGRIHGQFKVPPGCYLVRAAAFHHPHHNVFTEWAYVGVGCNETVCVNLMSPSLGNCIRGMITALQLGTAVVKGKGEVPLAELMPKEVNEATALLQTIADEIPEDSNLPLPPTAEEVRKAAAEPMPKPEK
jgi:hypothetical protein